MSSYNTPLKALFKNRSSGGTCFCWALDFVRRCYRWASLVAIHWPDSRLLASEALPHLPTQVDWIQQVREKFLVVLLQYSVTLVTIYLFVIIAQAFSFFFQFVNECFRSRTSQPSLSLLFLNFIRINTIFQNQINRFYQLVYHKQIT